MIPKKRTVNQHGGHSASEEIDTIIREAKDWRGKMLSELRTTIKKANPEIIEEVKWKKPSNPMGAPVWSHTGIICIGNVLKKSVRLTFPNGALIKDPKKIFNTRLDSKTVRARDFGEGEIVDSKSLERIIKEAIEINSTKAKTSGKNR